MKRWIFLSAVLAIFIYEYTQPKVFYLMFESPERENMHKLQIFEGDVETEYIFPTICSEAFKRCKIKVDVLSRTGTFNLMIIFRDQRRLRLENVEYEIGKTNYISSRGDEVGFVKAHWQ